MFGDHDLVVVHQNEISAHEISLETIDAKIREVLGANTVDPSPTTAEVVELEDKGGEQVSQCETTFM